MPTTERKGEWVAGDDNKNGLPPARYVKGPGCKAVHPDYYVCTRKEGHTGRHAAEGTKYVLAVWN